MFILLFIYLSILSFFGFVSNSISYCILLVSSSLISTLIIYCINGSIWYSLLLYLIYVGGVYILFLFLSVHIPNMSTYNAIGNYFYIFFFNFEIVYSFNFFNSFDNLDYSYLFCNYSSGTSYLFLCSFLVLSFILVSFISSTKIYFCR